MNRRTAAVTAALTLAGALLATAPAQADTASPAAKAPTGDGAKGICKRLPKTEARVDASLKRLNGDATVAGSVARLTQRVADAKAAGHTEVYTYLNDRLTFRKSLVPTLETRQADLKSVAGWCSAQGYSAAAK
ncbi:hypothetical protein CFP65_6151 [Kitasatospora sp. MMS16-BH015]|uniref:hypothetical protein n=1 Tax=Kitasatospora sp. MMS16-BH015 TaxID=2018025 RepID=UPI000CA37CC4|nr:hypothetical protein [Kitasatospora sp. MMS16-BH015]AUG80818.1 hypothetical protein CFP65_6151 [Kitasatospora sp. MMS16-BH015]